MSHLLFALVVAVAAPADLAVVVESPTHQVVQNDFESTAEPWTGRPIEDEPATVAVALANEPGRGGILRAINTVSGGYVGITILPPSQRWLDVPARLSFDYRADPRLKLNLFARVGHQDYEIGLFGPPCDTGRTIWLGQVEGAVADGQWHHVDIPLLRLLRTAQPTRKRLRLTELYLANQHQGDYLLAGFGGNQAGVSLEIDNFYLGRPGPATAAFAWRTLGGRAVDGYAVVADRRPDTVPADKITATAAELKLDGLEDGTHYLHVRAKAKDGGWGPVTHRRFEVDTRPPVAGSPEPAGGGKACPGVWRCQLSDAGVGVAPPSIVLETGGKRCTIEDPALSFDPLTGAVEFRPALGGVTWRDGETVTLTVTGEDENGIAMPAPLQTAFVLDLNLDRDPPENPELLLRQAGAREAEPFCGEGTFEHGLDGWKPFGAGGTVIERTTVTAASGRYSLRLLCTENASPFSCFVRATPFDAARYRLISFDYKIPPRLRVDFLLRHNDEYCRIRFTDRDDVPSLIGVVPNVIADNEWHHTEFDLYAMLRKRFPRDPDLTVGMLLLMGGPWPDAPKLFPGNYAGTEYFIDNFQFVPMLGADTRVEWRAADLSGVAGAEVVTVDDPAKLPPPDAVGVGRKIEGTSLSLEDIKQGLVYLWARLYDRRGNRSRPLVMRVLVDAGRPVVGEPSPAPGSRAAPAVITLGLRDDEGAGLDLAALRLRVADVEYAVDGKVLTYNEGAGKLVWDGRRAQPPVTFADGQVVAVALLEARDQAGNRPVELPTWQFTVDYSQDHRGPEVEITSPTHAAHYADGFNAEVPSWAPTPAGVATVSHSDDGRGAGGRAMVITPQRTDTPWSVWYEFPRPYAASRFKLIAFQYRIPTGGQLDFLVRCLDNRGQPVTVAIGLTGRRTEARRIGAVVDARADGQWHLALVPLHELLSAQPDLTVPYVVQAVGFGGPPAPAGMSFACDDFFVYRPATAAIARLSWQAYDETGVKGYSTVLDDRPDTVPPAQVTTAETSLSLDRVPPGTSWFHVRALDGAGNWGPAAHFVLATPP